VNAKQTLAKRNGCPNARPHKAKSYGFAALKESGAALGCCTVMIYGPAGSAAGQAQPTDPAQNGPCGQHTAQHICKLHGSGAVHLAQGGRGRHSGRRV